MEELIALILLFAGIYFLAAQFRPSCHESVFECAGYDLMHAKHSFGVGVMRGSQ